MREPLHILYLEDDRDDVEFVRNILERGGVACRVEPVRTRAQFETALAQGGIDLILSDYEIPGFDGLRALRMARVKSPGVPFILFSGSIGEDAAIETLHRGATDYVLKHRENRLVPAVRRALSEAEEQRKRMQAELALQREQEFLRAILESLEACVVACDSQGTLTLFNRAMRELYKEDVQPLPPQEWAAHYGFCHPDGETPLPLEAIPLYRALQGEQVCNVEVTVARAGAAPRTLLASGQPIRDAEGRKLGAVLTALDVTGKKQLEEQLRMAQKMEAVGRLAGGVAHDFNNLLNVILGYSDLSLGELDTGHPLRGKLEQIRKAAERAAGLTRQLLAFSRKQVIKPTVLDLNHLLAELDKMLHRLIGEDIDLMLVPAEDLGRIKADPGQIEQIVMNLVVNARDAMPQGGRLIVRTANVDLEREPARRRGQMQEGRYVLLAVSDTGTGMAPEVQARIFEPFFTTKEPGKGTGLGLATVYGIVKQNEGFVWVQSEAGKGATFEIFLRRSEEAPEVGHAAHDTLASPHGMETILVVEDEESIRNLVRESLEGCGYTVLEAGSGPEAEAIALRHAGTIHLLMSDVILPRMSGRELAQRLYQVRPGLKALFMSGYAEDAIAEQGVLEPGAPFLEKPFPLTVMVRKVREVLGQLTPSEQLEALTANTTRR